MGELHSGSGLVSILMHRIEGFLAPRYRGKVVLQASIFAIYLKIRGLLNNRVIANRGFALDLKGYSVTFLHFANLLASMHPIRATLSIFSLLLGFSLGIGQEASSEYRIAVVPKGTDRDRWQAIHAGALKASEELAAEGVQVEILWKGETVSRSDKQIQVVDTFTGQRLSGILVASIDETHLSGNIRIDRNSDLPLVYIDSGLDADRPLSYVATDNFQGGAIAADRIGQLTEGVGNVILLRHRQGDTNSEAREAGFIEKIKSEYPSIRMISIDQYAGDSMSQADTAAEYLLNRYGRRVNAVFASSASGADAMLNALRNFNLAGQVYLVGYEASSTPYARARCKV